MKGMLRLALAVGWATWGVAALAAGVASFTPSGEVKDVRQVVARFSEPMVTFGDPRTEPPFDIDCPAPGRGRWSDSRVWIHDFESELPAGLACTFRVKTGLKTVAGATVDAASFSFTTGGPAVRVSFPGQGWNSIDEEQVFLLALDAPADLKSVRERAYCTASGVGEKLALAVIEGDERRKIVEATRGQAYELFGVLSKRGAAGVIGVKQNRIDTSLLVVARCARRLPPNAIVQIVWDSGIRTASGIATSQPQTLSFKTRPEFTARQTCTRVNAEAGCVPVLPMALEFSAPITRALAEKIEARLADGRIVRPTLEAAAKSVGFVSFSGPFPERSEVVFTVPRGFVDDANRTLVNASLFPLKVRVDDDPPLIKFPSRFGILESNADPALPVTVRNVEATLKGMQLPLTGQSSGPGRALRVDSSDPAVLADWIRRILTGPQRAVRRGQQEPYPQPGELPLLSAAEQAAAAPIELPRAGAERDMAVIGIPLPAKGLYVVEFASARLGAALHGKDRPYYAYSSALVTNLAVHFKHGRESSLAWVTQLEDARPAAGVRVRVSDCTGKSAWEGVTDGAGIARIAQELPRYHRWQECPHAPNAYLVSAHKGDDFSFMLTSWSDGIRPWQFNLSGLAGADRSPLSAHTVTDRALFRAGETVSMKHFIRRRTGQGFAIIDAAALPQMANIVHVGSGQRFETTVQWRGNSAESTWLIPKEAKSGEYQIELRADRHSMRAGSFRVEQFRVPLMRATLKPPAAPTVASEQLSIDAQLTYLAGGPAGYAPVKFRSRLVSHEFSFRDYEDYRFGGAAPKKGADTGKPHWLIDAEEEGAEAAPAPTAALGTRNVTLDADGGTRLALEELPRVTTAHAVEVEMEYADPNGQILTAATRALLLPSNLVLGLRIEGYFATRERLSFKALALDAEGRVQSGRELRVDAYQRTRYAYRKRLLGGFYAYEQTTEVKKIGSVCRGKADARGLLACDGRAPVSGELILVAHGTDAAGNPATASAEVFVAGDENHWFEAGASDRIDLLADKRFYAPGETARFEVRMPFRSATALVSVEREGLLDSRVVQIDAKSPFIEVPMLASYGPNVIVSALLVRGRIDPVAPGRFAWLRQWFYRIGFAVGLRDHVPKEPDTRPTAIVDLTKPAFRLGLANVRVGWQGYELKVKVEPERQTYRVRERAVVHISVTDGDGKPAAGAEIALAAVDEGLLQLAPNRSWDLLSAMMQRRPLEVETSTAQGQVIGKRHFGKKAVAPGGGGGSSSARELFDTLLAWQPRVTLDAQGRARVEVPLNDALTAFRIEAVAHAGEARFGSGGTTIRTTQDLMLFAGVPPYVREGDRFNAMFTVRNGSERAMEIEVDPTYAAGGRSSAAGKQKASLAAGAAQTLSFAASAPVDASRIEWTVVAREVGPGSARAADTVKVTQTVGAAYPVRVYQQTLFQLAPNTPESFPVELPRGAIAGRGGVEVRLARSLGGDFASIREWMSRYPFTCIEQRASVAIALEDAALWARTMNTLPAHLDADGLVKFFPSPWLLGDDTLTSYLLAVAHEAKLEIPEDARDRMLRGLSGFVAGRVIRYGALPTADLAIRKIAAIEALARYGEARPSMLESIEIAPNLWPSSAVIDWWSLLTRLQGVRERETRIAEAKQILRSRMMYAGTTMAFSTEKADALWWLMVSPDRNAVRALLLATDDASFRDDIGRMARGALGRQSQGRWNTTIANAWGVLALRKFQANYERDPVLGVTATRLGAEVAPLDWKQSASRVTNDPTLGTPIGDGPEIRYAWPKAAAPLSLEHKGSGKPWAFVASKAALPLEQPLFAGYAIKRTVTPIEQKTKGKWTRGDVLRVSIEIDAQADMTWVAVADPVPAGTTILGTGLGGDSSQLAAGQRQAGWTRPAFEERTFEGFRAYYHFMPKGKTKIEYTARLNNAGHFEMPAARVEAMYAPEVFGEVPIAKMEIGQ